MKDKISGKYEYDGRAELKKTRKQFPKKFKGQPIVPEDPEKSPLGHTWTWGNFVWACSICNTLKGSKPETHFIKPTETDPCDFLVFDPVTGIIDYRTDLTEDKKGEVDILKDLNLNSSVLRNARGRKIRRILILADLLQSKKLNRSQCRQIVVILKEELNKQESYLGCFRQLCFSNNNGASQGEYNLVQKLLQNPEIRKVVNKWYIRKVE
jgi:hypothetical protein